MHCMREPMSTKGKRRSSQDSGCVKVHTVTTNSMRLTSISFDKRGFLFTISTDISQF
jgi:hypothetical protein